MLGSRSGQRDVSFRRARLAARAFILAFGFLQAFNARYYLQGGDAVSYLDLGDLLWSGRWREAVNGYWSPLYPLMVAAVRRLLSLGINEAIAFHLVNWLTLPVSLLLVESFARELAKAFAFDDERPLLFAGYTLCVWAFCRLIHMQDATPDFFVAVFAVGASVLLLKIANRGPKLGYYLLLGAALGLGYLSKSIFFVLAPLFLVAAFFSARNWRKTLPLTICAALLYSALALPWVIALSVQKGRFTFGDSGQLAYAWYVNHVPSGWTHWRGRSETDGGIAKHPTRQLSVEPPAYEFRSERGTFPPWFDPSYWNEGLRARFDARQQLAALGLNLKTAARIFFAEPTSLLFLFWFASMVALARLRLKALEISAPVLLVPLVGTGLYLLVYLESRYVGGFVLILYLTLAATLRSATTLRWTPRVWLACSMVALAPLCVSETIWFYSVNFANRARTTEHQVAARELRMLGLRPGDEIAVLGLGVDAFFARYARLKIIAESPRPVSGAAIWARDAETEAKAVEILSRTGVKAIVRDVPLDGRSTVRWQPLGATRFSVMLVEPRR